MTNWQELVEKKGDLAEWPYPLRYDVENEVSVDVIVLGGGIAGCHAAINAAKKGAKVAICDTAHMMNSGAGGTGVDHWHLACSNPCSKVTSEETTDALVESYGGYEAGHKTYLHCKESYPALLDVEKMGVQVRDVTDEFKGADFRDDETKLMFAYDYVTNICVRVCGAAMKPCLYKELKRQGIGIFDWVKATSLLTVGGKPGSRVVGATGINVRTGEFYIFKAKSTIVAMANPYRLWYSDTEWRGFGSVFPGEPNCVGDGIAMAWNAGAEFGMMETTNRWTGPYGWPNFSVGSPYATWFPCSMVDSNGKEIPWVDRDGNVLKTVSERCRPAPGQKFLLPGLYHPVREVPYEYRAPIIIPDLEERIRKGEYVLPLYADLPGMPEHERRAIFGLMVGNEGKTRYAVYVNYTQAGFDPDKDMLQNHGAYVTTGQTKADLPEWRGVGNQHSGGLIVDWDLKTTLDGLYAAGQQIVSGADHSGAAATGRYAGRKAAEHALTASEPVIDPTQVSKEKARIYGLRKRTGEIGWKELSAQIARVMQDYCGKYKHESTLKTGLRWFEEIRESEALKIDVRNPHELIRALDCHTLITVGEIIMQASLARKASSFHLDFYRLDYPEVDPKEWNKFVTIKLEGGKVKVGELPFNYWLLPPYAPTYEENYKLHASL